jgi:oxygen-independent coproporphyrinogen-3 oxidase
MAPTPAPTASPTPHLNQHLFCQNQRDLRAYVAALERGELPVERGLVVRDPAVLERHALIRAVMGDFQVELSEARGRGWPG